MFRFYYDFDWQERRLEPLRASAESVAVRECSAPKGAGAEWAGPAGPQGPTGATLCCQAGNVNFCLQ